MPVRLRLARYGTRNNPFYHLVAIADYKPRDARPIEKLGEYDPIPRVRKFKPPPFNPDAPVLSSGLPHAVNVSALSSSSPSSGVAGETAKEKRLEWNTERIKYWLRVGAQPSKPVARMLDRAGLIPEGKWFKGMYRPPIEGSHFAPAFEKPAAARAAPRQADDLQADLAASSESASAFDSASQSQQTPETNTEASSGSGIAGSQVSIL